MSKANAAWRGGFSLLASRVPALLLAGCAGLDRPPSAPVAPVNYACEDGRTFSVSFAPGGAAAVIDINRMRFDLRQEPAASGIRYACDVLTLTNRGDEAQLEIQGEAAYTGCRVVPATR
jgi:membrane-bound inhibitor of C-type lysozyme